jgi:hypothetical protein
MLASAETPIRTKRFPHHQQFGVVDFVNVAGGQLDAERHERPGPEQGVDVFG